MVVGIFTRSTPHLYREDWVRFLRDRGLMPSLHVGLYALPEGHTSTAHCEAFEDIVKAVAVTVFLSDSSEAADTNNWIVGALEYAEQWNTSARREIYYCVSEEEKLQGETGIVSMNAHAAHVIRSVDEMRVCLREMIRRL